MSRVNTTSLQLQSVDSDLNTSVALLQSLKSFIESVRDDFSNYEILGKKITACDDYEYNKKRVSKRSMRLDSLDCRQTENVPFTNSNKFRVECYIPVIDQLMTSLIKRISAYIECDNYFGFLRKLDSLSLEEIRKQSLKIVQFYENDLEENLAIELVQFREFSKQFISNSEDKENTKLCYGAKLYKLIIEKNLQDIFPNICILLKIYLVLMTTNCTSERSFSKLKLIKNRLRSSMNQNRLNNLSLKSIESDLLEKLSFSDIIDDFTEKNSRKVFL